MRRRFKTEEEMVATLGNTWRDSIENGWNKQMDSLFGQPEYCSEACNWDISEQMLTEYELSDEEQKILDNYNKIAKDIKIEEVNGGWKIIYKNYYSFNIIINPTGNCQLASINAFNGILGDIKDTFVIKAILYYIRIYKNIKPLLFFDINEFHFPTIENSLPLLWSQGYISTNGSEMICGMINLRKVNIYEL